MAKCMGLRGHRRVRVAMFVAASGAAPALGLGQTNATWLNATSGNWTDASNWSTGPGAYPNNTPNISYDAIVNATGAGYTMSLSSSISLSSLTMNSGAATMDQYGGTMTAGVLNLQAGSYLLNNGLSSDRGAIQDTRINFSGGTLTSSGGVLGLPSLTNTTFAGTSILAGASFFIQNDLRLDDAVLSYRGNASRLSFAPGSSLVGTGELNYDNDNGQPTGNQLNFVAGATIGSGITIRTVKPPGGTFTGTLKISAPGLTSNGTINSEASLEGINIDPGQLGDTFTNGGTLSATAGRIDVGRMRNSGLISASGTGIITLANVVTNSGVITGSGGATIGLYGAQTLAALGNFSSVNTTLGGTLDVSGALNLDGFGALSVGDSVNAAELDRASVTSVTLGKSLTLSGKSTLRDVTLGVSSSASNASLSVFDSLTLANQTFTMTGTSMSMNGPGIAGTGRVVLGTNNNNSSITTNGTTTVSSGISIVTGGGTGTATVSSPFSGKFIVNGTIENHTSGKVLAIGGVTENNGSIVADSGSVLFLSGTLANAGSVSVDQAILRFGITSFTNTGTFSVTHSDLLIARSMSLAEFKTLPMATNRMGVGPGGTLDATVSGGLLNLDATTGSLLLAGGAIQASRISADPAFTLSSVTGTTSVIGTPVTLAMDMDVAVGSTLAFAGSLTLDNAVISLNGSGSGVGPAMLRGNTSHATLAGTGAITFNGGQAGGMISPATGPGDLTIGSGVIVQTGTQGGTVAGTVINEGTIAAVTPGKTLSISGGTGLGVLSNTAGTIEALNGGVVQLSSSLLPSGSTLTATAGKLVVGVNSKINIIVSDTYTTNAADVTLDGAGSAFPAFDEALATNSGKFTIRNGRSWSTEQNFTNSGTLTVGKDSTFTVFDLGPNVGTLSNTGKIKGKGTIRATVINNGNIAPGESPGLLTIDGNLTQSSTGVLEIEIGGPNAESEYDVLNVTGTATFAGTLRLLLVNGYVPGDNQTFHFVTAPSIAGNFSSFDLPALPGGQQWDTEALLSGSVRTTPEPGGLSLLGAAAVMLRRARRR